MTTDARNRADQDQESDTPEGFRYLPVATVGDLPPGELLRVEVGARLVCLANVEGRISAFDDDCPHISGPLDEGDLEGCVLTCPIHLAQFDARTGRVLRGPARDDLRMYPVRVEGDTILIGEPSGAEEERH